MGLLDKIKGEFIDIIEWTDDTQDTMVYRFERHQNEIKMGAKLTVREGQEAVFVNQGQIADVFEPGMYELKTENLPILSTLKGWKYGFNSPFKAEVYFINTKRFTDLKWGTKNAIVMRDPEFGPIRVRAFGTYSIRVKDAAKFIREIVGTDGEFTKDEITDQLRNLIVSNFADSVASARIPVLDMAANYQELGDVIRGGIDMHFTDYGLDLLKLLVENISLPPAVEEMLDKRTSMGIVGNLQQYSQFQLANAMEQAAQNPGGMASGGMGMGMGFAMANQMGQAMQQPQVQQPMMAPPPLPASFFVAIDGNQSGPFDTQALQQMISQKRIDSKTLVWAQGMTGWQAAGSVPALAALFQSMMPPPLP